MHSSEENLWPQFLTCEGCAIVNRERAATPSEAHQGFVVLLSDLVRNISVLHGREDPRVPSEGIHDIRHNEVGALAACMNAHLHVFVYRAYSRH